MQENNKVNYLSDYKPSDFSILDAKFDFSLHDSHTLVTSCLKIKKDNPDISEITLQGEGLELVGIALNGHYCENYKTTENSLTVRDVPNEFLLSTQVKIHPEKNTLLEGLYRSNNIFCTQCEAEGFRRITYFLDRPDVMSKYTVRIEANQAKYPVLLSNGNLIKQGELNNGRHFAVWEDPFRKPSYLFALVAGDLAHIEKNIKTQSGREVLLQIFTEKPFIGQADFALQSLEKALRWDEQTFDLEYDLNRYMVVAIGDFNMGAMENKGLNVFNSKFVLATPETAVDQDFLNIENIIGHEYFHNWTGNRVTCRDWFQLSLKEGLTVFRDGLFSADMTTKGIKRLEEIRTVREYQFIEDQGPMSHPVRPDSYIEINNFYTLTVYEKGSEVIRMMYNMMGEKLFKAGIKLYFERHDGQAVTVEDFAQAMTDASGIDLMGQFFLWYTQAGTPKLTVTTDYDEKSKTFKVNFKQSQAINTEIEKKPLMIPINYRLFNEAGESMSSERVFVLKEDSASMNFASLSTKPILSVLRHFSAPVELAFELSDIELATLVKFDDDLFVRFNSLQTLLKRYVLARLVNEDKPISALISVYQAILDCEQTPVAEKAELLKFPELSVFYDVSSPVQIDALATAVKSLQIELFKPLAEAFYHGIAKVSEYAEDDLSFAAMSERAFKNSQLQLLAKTEDDSVAELAYKRFSEAVTMNTKMSALTALNQFAGELRDNALNAFYEQFKNDPQVVDKWLSLEASLNSPSVIERIKTLSGHAAFSFTNPNKVRALYSAFCMRNPEQFHQADGAGYQLLSELVSKMDDINPSIAARLLSPLTQWRKFDEKRAELMREQLKQLLSKDNLSKDVYEIVSKSLV